MEIVFVIIMIMISQLLFSFLMGSLKELFHVRQMLSINYIKDELYNNFEIFLLRFSKIKGARLVNQNDVRSITHHLDSSFLGSHNRILKDEFFLELSPYIRRKLVFHLFRDVPQKFPYFFDDFEFKYKACDEFTYQILLHMECFIIIPGEVLVSAHNVFKQLYFV